MATKNLGVFTENSSWNMAKAIENVCLMNSYMEKNTIYTVKKNY